MALFGKSCLKHKQDVGLFCTICGVFRCVMCEDSHYSTGGIISTHDIIEYSKMLQFSDVIIPFKDQLSNIYTECVQFIRNAHDQSNQKICNLFENYHRISNDVSQLKLNKQSIDNLKSATPIGEFQNMATEFKNIVNEFEALCNSVKKAHIGSNEVESYNKLMDESFGNKAHEQCPMGNISIHAQPIILDESFNKGIREIRKNSQRSSSTYRLSRIAYKQPKQNSYILIKSSITAIKQGCHKQMPCFSFSSLQKCGNLIDAVTELQNPSEDEKLIYYYIDYTNKLIVYNPLTKSRNEYTFDKEFKHYSESIAIGSRIFLIGGLSSVAVNDVYEANLETKILIPREAIPVCKCEHSLCLYQSHIYSIGGWNGNALKSCEVYSVKDNHWQILPSLNMFRCWAGSCVYNSAAVYAFFGQGRYGNVDTIEKLDIKHPYMWNMIDIMLNNCAARNSLQCLQISSTEIMIYGGENNNYATRSCFKLDLSEKYPSFVECSSMVCECQFFQTTAPIVLKNVVYAIDKMRNIHLYNLDSNKWSIIES